MATSFFDRLFGLTPIDSGITYEQHKNNLLNAYESGTVNNVRDAARLAADKNKAKEIAEKIASQRFARSKAAFINPNAKTAQQIANALRNTKSLKDTNATYDINATYDTNASGIRDTNSSLFGNRVNRATHPVY